MTDYVNGYSVSANRDAIGIKTYRPVPGVDVLLPVRSSIAPLLIGAARAFHFHVEPLHPGWCWGYAFRQITGGSGYSWHSAGIAIDLNAPMHPYGSRGTMTPMQNYLCRAISRKYGLRWGGDYVTNADEMHFEVILPPAAARVRVAELARRNPPVIPFPGVMARGDSGFRVRVVQRALNRRPLSVNVRVDGEFGPRTEQAVMEFEKRHGLTVDGTVGRVVWNALF